MTNQSSENVLNFPLEIATDNGYKFSWFDWFCLWYPPGWLILFNRHWQHYHKDSDGWNWLEYILFLLPGGFYLALLMRWLRLGCRAPKQEIDEFDPNYQKAFKTEILAPIVKYYFQGKLQQIENLPQTGPLIVAMNHAGMSFPWDFITLAALLSEEKGWIVQPVAEVALFEHPWMIWWLPAGWSKVLGGVRAELNAFEAAIEQRKIILYAPEGVRGPRKGWRRRYQLQKFDVSFMQLSDRYQVPILPVVCVGNEYLHPWTINFQKLQRLFKLPFLPLSPLMLLLILFPSMGVWAMKTRLHYYIQAVEPLSTAASFDNSRQKRTNVYQRAQQLRAKLQMQINQLVNGR